MFVIFSLDMLFGNADLLGVLSVVGGYLIRE